MITVVLIFSAYLLGSISFAVVASWLFKLPDPRSYGSRNPGATNVLRTGKKAAAAVTLLGDAGKGWVAVAAAKYGGEVWELGDEVIAGAALAVFLGHLFPIFLAFKGGKGVATSAGILLGLNPWLGVLTISTWMVVALVSRISSLSALLSALLAPLYAYFLLEKGILIMAVSIISVLLILKHRLNIANLMAGKEARIGKSS
ncbi:MULTISPECIES: glycerol-3-phosphate 1-O-acyltransferase PlsY [Nitrosomonas]|uniref:Glycerol-3-phosphate acyltransferase n=1 Tax=Nitrosomonas europaea (strain ATCC 19718 / CIP 103999 / KCTC 2705 / NBRC 14298) TaxID=228410 RepID=PLSY_NITEU|nr:MULTISPECIES: glycerol-3-phosphate 1-O-acyltransferase PlsY [Nitrosomonas]Q82XN3.1 RecName: Full=Glycerol-3-phosphate acyltransferase; AltName: Full=Acyl-PO4 G3P acyltransferase; AltName: Full=Acyl-phosphate--glycerol-3-phosphate acyltransferase; AltName: Full=G3P acyltransferase; Short=GPAT; AltName: Full=Lysophosphatidic acid synthase; Short=LPA synthase [Nitrosomonas europaea ATCC 19718]MCE7916096.1 glycerol-3-phosphate 1-O-acyltransferase [Nitrosomonas sp. PRO5]KXK40285.1 MAG: Glycerol-3-